MTKLRVLALSGGVGGSKLLAGLAALSERLDLTVVANTGDDFTHYGLQISPDVDTVLYALSGRSDPATGWGLAGDTHVVLRTLEALGADPWFRLGDRDLATHLLRTQMLRSGLTLTDCTRRISRAMGIEPVVLPMTDEPFATQILTDDGWTAFQTWFVRQGCRPPARDVRYGEHKAATPTQHVLEAISRADAIIVCPSNPYLSIGPILALEGVRSHIASARAPAVAVSPIVAGAALKGPTAALLKKMAGESTNLALVRLYSDMLDGLVIDCTDGDDAPALVGEGLAVEITDTVMFDDAGRVALAETVVDFADRLRAPPGEGA